MRIEPFLDEILKAGEFAYSSQEKVARGIKSDGTVITEVDLEINRRISLCIKERYPDANLITEEAVDDFDPKKEYTFVLDPLDGTDVYSQGMPGWCIALGLLRNLEPVAGIIYAPSWGPKNGNLLFTDVDGPVYHNGTELHFRKEEKESMHILIPSSIHRDYSYSDFPGKIRNTGSSIVSLSGLIFHDSVNGVIINRGYIWDMAASDAVIRKCGFLPEYLCGGKIYYSELTDRSRQNDYVVCGLPSVVSEIRKNFKRKKNG